MTISVSRASLREIAAKIEHDWPRKRVLVVGDVMLDRYIWGEVSRISPEAPIPVVQTTQETVQPGGAANVAMNIAKLGAAVTLVGFTGTDEDKELLLQSLRANDIEPHLVSCYGFPTISKTRVVCGRQQMIRFDRENLACRTEGDYERLLELAIGMLPTVDVVVLSDYAKGVLVPNICQAVIQEAKRLSIPVLVDPKADDFARYKGATTICPNLNELAAALHEESRDLDTLLDAAERMAEELELSHLTVTLGERGIAVVKRGAKLFAAANAKQVFDVSGAGDTVISVLALCMASNVGTEESMQLANSAAGVVVGKVGTAPIEKQELLNSLGPAVALNAESKLVPALDELVRRVDRWRANAERIVFTNGCFDLLHVGHIVLLEEARDHGERLIVAVNSDASVAALKGSNRPVVDERSRARILAALTSVDAVIVFDDATPLELILATRPDVIVKGGDYDESSVVGAGEAEMWGGKVVIVPIVEGHSTTGVIERLFAATD
ncbi:D-glycero-beta-D-manno-heptose-7-phosphate kinase [Occallatibacter riparius]|uniref:Bifunctional protein HldE n=1 Tax=Occallatibacter riparius TaxID=1002689 RepID=A0A9J7BWW3_9BACT|nr:D-glycero-beta-D-manno-heptose-7-phosphate kinase [Occallatibacter riparius]UWZ85533.1 D-glycero-beta-D-manno-heptose-7-phosphate kinase [Occallatibacter riparius]